MEPAPSERGTFDRQGLVAFWDRIAPSYADTIRKAYGIDCEIVQFFSAPRILLKTEFRTDKFSIEHVQFQTNKVQL